MNDKERREKAIDRVAAKKTTPAHEWQRTIPGFLQLEALIEEKLIEKEEEDKENDRRDEKRGLYPDKEDPAN